MYILGIESSCDDTSAALLKCSDEGHVIISEKTASQIDTHAKYGGVVPEIAGRLHAEKIVPLIEAVLKDRAKPDAIAVTSGPGLVTGLLVGVAAAQTLSYATGTPLIGINHIEGHIHSVELEARGGSGKPIADFPALALVVSGGHTELILMKNRGNCAILGSTKDDAAGECFDKVAKLLGFSYPGGPQISKFAETGYPQAIDFPRPMLDQDNFDFSFAGLKTSALYWLRDNKIEGKIENFCASFEQAIVDVLVGKTIKATQRHRPKTIILAGGVAANKKLRESLKTAMNSLFPDSRLMIPNPEYCMDNAAMIAAAGYHRAQQKKFTPWNELKVDPNWKISRG